MLVLLGPSKSGKTTIAAKLSDEYGMEQQVTYTTREPRPGEVDGVHYNFISRSKFGDMLMDGLFCEYDIYRGEYYGSTLEGVKDPDRLVAVLTPMGLQSYRERAQNVFAVQIDSKKEIRARIMLSAKNAVWDAIVRQVESDDKLYYFEKTGANEIVMNEYSDKMGLVDRVFNLYVDFLKYKR